MTLDGLTLPDHFLWQNEYEWNEIEQETERTLTGALMVSESKKTFGQSIVLGDGENSWLTLSELQQFNSLTKTINKKMQLVLADGREFTVIFDRQDGSPIEAEPLFPQQAPSAEHLYAVIIRLMTVAADA